MTSLYKFILPKPLVLFNDSSDINILGISLRSQTSPKENDVVSTSADESSENIEKIVVRQTNMPQTLQDLLCRNSSLYFFFVLTGILWPMTRSQKLSTRIKYWLLQFWVVLVHCCLLGATVLFFVTGCVTHYAQGTTENRMTGTLSWMITLQMTCIIASIAITRQELTRVHDVAILYYSAGLVSSLPLSFALIFIDVLSGVTTTAVGTGAGGTPLLLVAIASIPLFGATSLLISDQRVSRLLLLSLDKSMVLQTATAHDYIQILQFLEERDRTTALTLLLVPAVVSTIVAAAFLFVLGFINAAFSSNPLSARGGIAIASFLIDGCIRETMVLLVLLYEMAKVNEVSDGFAKLLARADWRENGHDQERISLYMLSQQYPLGAKVFGTHPSRRTLLLHIVTTVLSLVVSAVSKFFFHYASTAQ